MLLMRMFYIVQFKKLFFFCNHISPFLHPTVSLILKCLSVSSFALWLN